MTDRREEVLAGFGSIWDKYRPAVMGRVERLEDAAMALLSGALDPEARRAAERDAHSLAGSVGTFGFTKGSQVAREIEYLLQGSDEPGSNDALKMSQLVVALRDALESEGASSLFSTAPHSDAPGPRAASLLPEVGPDRPLCWVIESDSEMRTRLRMECEGRGMEVTPFGSVPPTPLPPSVREPDVVVLATTQQETMGFLDRCARRDPPIPVIVLGAQRGPMDRVEVARLGGRAFLQKPVPPIQVVEAVSRALEHRKQTTASVLCVDDDASVLAVLDSLMSAGGFKVTTLEDASRFWDVLQATSPDVVVLDLDMPGVSGIDLCKVMRNDTRWARVPVVFLAAQRDAEVVASIFAAGADDFVSKPIVGPELLARITNRLERLELVRSVIETDPVTGLPNRKKVLEGLEQFRGMPSRNAQPMAVAVVSIDGLKTINVEAGYGQGDRVLRSMGALLRKHFRGDDVIGHWTGASFLVGMFGMTRADGVQRVAEALEEFRTERLVVDDRRIPLSFSAGVAEFPSDGDATETVRATAEAALVSAKESGGNKVRYPGWTSGGPGGQALVDVAVVEDDEAIAGLLLHALETRGHSSVVITDGQEAVDLLAGASPQMQARVILLDVDLPSLDGLGVLRRLQQHEVLARTTVIMLTARSAEIEILRAMELGAFDHVAKPFSIPVLMQRVRRGLEVAGSPARS